MKVRVLALAVVCGFISACAHKIAAEKKVEAELAQEPAIATGGPAAIESRKLIEENSSLTAQQRQKLLDLHSKMAGEAAIFRTEMGKLKMVFFRTLLNPEAGESELSNVKERIVELDRKKLDHMLSAAEKAIEILGRQSREDEKILRAFSLEHPGAPGQFGW